MDATTARWQITEAWEHALGHGEYTDDDDFFAVGGDSLRATQLVRALVRAGLAVDLAIFMSEPTVTGLVRAATSQPDELRTPELRRMDK